MVAQSINATLSVEQKQLLDIYSFHNYVYNIKMDVTLSRDKILQVERATRGQAENPLWNLLRLDRQTASANVNARDVPQSAAMAYGILQEKSVKAETELMRAVRELIEKTLGARVVNIVLDCGLFFSRFGLHSASPDAYFVTDAGQFVPLEIKCPQSYQHTTQEEMRSSLNTRKPRYRVKHTAFSVNKSGAAIFVVEKTDPHYRQMQRQMYVLDAPLAVYLVKFKNSYVVNTVERDVAFCEVERKTEEAMFARFAARNQNKQHLRFETKRVHSFAGKCHHFADHQVRALAAAGLYYDYGQVACINCAVVFDADAPFEAILGGHCSKKSENNIYCDFSARARSLIAAGHDPELAKLGVYDDGTNTMKTFCCQQTVKDFVIHRDECKYMAMASGESSVELIR